MKPTPDYRAKHYGPQRHRGLQAALIQSLGAEFPRLGGPRILTLCAELITEIIDAHLVARDQLGHGQVIWCAIDVDDRPRRGQSAQNTRLIPVILTLHHADDLEVFLQRKMTLAQIRVQRALRLCREAHKQGALLSNVDLSLLLGINDSQVASMLCAHEEEHDEVIPRRTTLHDMGSGVTHKRIICRKRYLEGKDPAQVARETWHTLESVDRYLGQYDRVRHCRQEGMDVAATAHILGCGKRLVREYLAIDDQINEARTAQKPASTDKH